MRILYVKMPGYEWVSVPSDAVVRELVKLGVEVDTTTNMSSILPKKYDAVWSPYEHVAILGRNIAKRIGAPHIAHIEWLPPWRISKKCDYTLFGFDGKSPEIKGITSQVIDHYLEIGRVWGNADIRTIAGRGFIDYVCNATDTDKEGVVVRYPSIDTQAIETCKRMYNVQKIHNRVITIARAVPNKRYDLLVKVMNKINCEVEWAIIGDGPELSMVKEELKNPKVKLNILGSIWGYAKYAEIMKSKTFLGAWSGMPPFECSGLGCYPIIIQPVLPDFITEPTLVENTMPNCANLVFENDDNWSNEVATRIHLNIEDQDSYMLYSGLLYKDMLDNKCGITSSAQNALNLKKMVSEVI